MDELVIRGFWGPREETAPDVAQRWVAFLQRLEKLDPGELTGWSTTEGGLDPREILPLEVSLDGLTARVLAGADEDFPELGYRVSAWTGPSDRAKVDVSSLAGMTSGNPQLRNSVVVGLERVEEADVPRLAPVAVDLLTTLVEEWQPDWGDFYLRSLENPLLAPAERPTGTPVAGIATYLSPGRVAAVPDAAPGRRVPTGDGGLVIDLRAADGALPALDEIVALDKALRDSDAFAPTPTTRPRI